MNVILFGIQLLGDAAELRIQVESYWIRLGTLLNDNEFSIETGHRNTGQELHEDKAELSYTQKSQVTTRSGRREMSVRYRLQE